MIKKGLKKWITLAAKVAGVFFVISVVAFFSLRGYFLRKAIDKARHKLETQYQTKLVVNDAGFEGFAGVSLKGIQLIPQNKDTLLVLDEFSLSIKFLYALMADVRVKSIHMHNGYLQLTKRGEEKNISAFLGNAADSTGNAAKDENGKKDAPASETNFAEVFYKLITKVLNKVPAEVEIDHFVLKGVDDSTFVNFNIQKLDYKDGNLNAAMEVVSNELTQHWQLKGMAYPSERKADLEFSSADSNRVTIPYLPERFNLLAGFHSARLQIENISFEGEELKINGSAGIQSLLVNHAKISKKDVVVDAANFKFDYNIGANYICLDSSSLFTLNGYVLHPFARYQKGPDTIYALVLRSDMAPAQKFLDALPEGLFSHLKGMEASGTFSYRLDFMYNENHPDDMVFESTLEKNDLRILKYGEANLSKLNGEFVYTPLENGKPQRPILVGMGNPYFAPLDMISPYVKKCVLTCEDPSFYWHRGFVGEAFRRSISKNIRSGKFKQGASTISMQLMKNVFLTREKTMARKLEEILLVYILENNRISSKDRMFEVYLNIIEWGPGVYGIGEASQYYFRKSPADLSLSESMFLATIVPSPKHFMWRFSKDGSAKPYLERTYRFLAQKMISREFILPEDTLGLTHQINISGPARKYIIKSDSLVADTVVENELRLIEAPEENHEED